MAGFYTTRGLSYHIDELIKNGDKFVILLTPYLKFSKTLYERLQILVGKNIELSIVYGKTQLTSEQDRLIKKLGCNIYFKENLHAKCYLNEKEAIICSMNLHSFSEVNNIEMGVRLDKRKDKSAYVECFDEIDQVIKNSKPIKLIKRDDKKTEKKYTYDEFVSEWYEALNLNFRSLDLKLNQGNISASNSTDEGFTLSNSYGFITIELKGNSSFLKSFRNTHQKKILEHLDDYRCYWSSPYNRIFLYHSKNIEFSNIKDDIKYCLKGINILIDNLKNTLHNTCS